MRDQTGTKGIYKPIIFPNDFWHLRSQYFEVNETTPRVPLRVEFQPMSYFKFQMFASLGFGFNEAAKQQGGAGTAEIDEIKRTRDEPIFPFANRYRWRLACSIRVPFFTHDLSC